MKDHFKLSIYGALAAKGYTNRSMPCCGTDDFRQQQYIVGGKYRISVSYKENLRGDDILRAIRTMEEDIQAQCPHITRIYIEARRLADHGERLL